MMLLLDPTPLARGLVRKKVEVVNYPDGRFAVQFNGATLGFKVFDKIQTVQPGAIVDNKRLSAVLEQVKAQQATYPARQQRGHIARRGEADRPCLKSQALRMDELGVPVLLTPQVRFALDSPLEEAGFEPSVPPRDRDRLQHLQACIPEGKWVPVPCRSCRVAPISRSCGWFEPENLGGKAMV
jgi:hypothetical protein